MTKLLEILKSPIAVSIVYAAVALYGTWTGVEYLIEEEPEVVPVRRVISYDEEMRVLQDQINEIRRMHQIDVDEHP